MFKKFLITIIPVIAILFYNSIFAQDNAVKWTYSVNQEENSKEADIIITAEIAHDYVIYSQLMPENGPLPTEIKFNTNKNFTLVGQTEENPKAGMKFDEGFEMEVPYHKGKVNFIQHIQILSNSDFVVSGTIDYQVCSGMMCIPNDTEFSVKVKGLKLDTVVADTKIVRADTVVSLSQDDVVAANNASPEDDIDNESSSQDSFWWFILLAIGAGFAAVLTPCVFPMIPMTVSFFISGDGKKGSGFLKGLIFGVSIALIYSLLGVVVALTKSANFANVISTHWISNSIFFLLFLVFAASFFGMFEMNILTGFSNKMDRKADKGGYISAFFMALVMTIVSFSCTGPFVASLLVEASFGASVLKPILGMFAFGLAMGSPFIVLSLFPALLRKLPKSGGWLNSIKVVFAFVLMAFAMKFLLNIDTAYNLNIFTRDVYISIWIVLFTLMGFYLLGKIKFSHDSEVKHIGVLRLLCVIATFSFVLYLFTGFFGAKLENISSLLPAASTNSHEVVSTSNSSNNDIQVKYGDRLHLPDNRFGFFDDEGLAYAKKINKPVLLVFKGHSCSICKQMEAESWGKPEISTLLNNFVIIAIYCDDKMELPENEWITSTLDGKVKKTMGKKNSDFELSRFKTNQLPYYVILDKDGKQIGTGIGYAKTDKFAEFLVRE